MTVPVIDWSQTLLFTRYRDSGILDFKTQDEEQDFTVFHNLHELEVTIGVIQDGYQTFKHTAHEDLMPYYMKA